jgi:glyoxylase I family protein
VEQTIRFYQDLLGFPLVELVENRDYPGSSHFFLDLGNSTLLGFFDFPKLGLQPGVESIGSVQHIAISVPRDRWEQLRSRLDEAGVPYHGPDAGIEESMYLKDPDGIGIELLSDPLMYFAGHRLDE